MFLPPRWNQKHLRARERPVSNTFQFGNQPALPQTHRLERASSTQEAVAHPVSRPMMMNWQMSCTDSDWKRRTTSALPQHTDIVIPCMLLLADQWHM